MLDNNDKWLQTYHEELLNERNNLVKQMIKLIDKYDLTSALMLYLDNYYSPTFENKARALKYMHISCPDEKLLEQFMQMKVRINEINIKIFPNAFGNQKINRESEKDFEDDIEK